jgi:hypothetical protein
MAQDRGHRPRDPKERVLREYGREPEFGYRLHGSRCPSSSTRVESAGSGEGALLKALFWASLGQAKMITIAQLLELLYGARGRSNPCEQR